MATNTAPGGVLTLRELNRALLARQLLLRRSELTAAQAVRHLVALQTQVPHNHYTALFSRLAGFDPEDFSRRFAAREFVRIALLRNTIHTVTADDCVALRPLFRPIMERPMPGTFARHLGGVDQAAVAARARELAEQQPRTWQELGTALLPQWPHSDARALGMVARQRLPMVQTPPRGLWRQGGLPRHTTAEHWLGRPLAAPPGLGPDALVLRYFAAFGPASVKDLQLWCGLTRLRPVVERNRDRLVAFRDESGTELFDLPDAPRPSAGTPAPVRFLPEFDNIFLGHADRSRIISPAARNRTWKGNQAFPVLLVDGFVRGIWRLESERNRATLTATVFGDPLTAGQRADAGREAARLLAFHAPGAAVHDQRWRRG
ncbi:winged helix DNA-binding domain-containing protein [Streptomyces aidingensis]|uniref:Winged helix DNA-binding domain-containing protein n=1 Tax=Streptomyces aidingensis TaxID=910347 RepID=A0A1I1ITR3_9ACTN|nr:winged helix DNA-binding domain-containing protein [Streptomyces aidingensis]SFC39112.1 Winged helix DNA-binding domain-containing protein [Streptomyces aidingensis]